MPVSELEKNAERKIRETSIPLRIPKGTSFKKGLPQLFR
jgi:hypothetical protein